MNLQLNAAPCTVQTLRIACKLALALILFALPHTASADGDVLPHTVHLLAVDTAGNPVNVEQMGCYGVNLNASGDPTSEAWTPSCAFCSSLTCTFDPLWEGEGGFIDPGGERSTQIAPIAVSHNIIGGWFVDPGLDYGAYYWPTTAWTLDRDPETPDSYYYWDGPRYITWTVDYTTPPVEPDYWAITTTVTLDGSPFNADAIRCGAATTDTITTFDNYDDEPNRHTMMCEWWRWWEPEQPGGPMGYVYMGTEVFLPDGYVIQNVVPPYPAGQSFGGDTGRLWHYTDLPVSGEIEFQIGLAGSPTPTPTPYAPDWSGPRAELSNVGIDRQMRPLTEIGCVWETGGTRYTEVGCQNCANHPCDWGEVGWSYDTVGVYWITDLAEEHFYTRPADTATRSVDGNRQIALFPLSEGNGDYRAYIISVITDTGYIEAPIVFPLPTVPTTSIPITDIAGRMSAFNVEAPGRFMVAYNEMQSSTLMMDWDIDVNQWMSSGVAVVDLINTDNLLWITSAIGLASTAIMWAVKTIKKPPL